MHPRVEREQRTRSQLGVMGGHVERELCPHPEQDRTVGARSGEHVESEAEREDGGREEQPLLDVEGKARSFVVGGAPEAKPRRAEHEPVEDQSPDVDGKEREERDREGAVAREARHPRECKSERRRDREGDNGGELEQRHLGVDGTACPTLGQHLPPGSITTPRDSTGGASRSGATGTTPGRPGSGGGLGREPGPPGMIGVGMWIRGGTEGRCGVMIGSVGFITRPYQSRCIYRAYRGLG